MDCSHNHPCLTIGLPSLSRFVLSDFPVRVLNKRWIKGGLDWLSLLYQGKESDRCIQNSITQQQIVCVRVFFKELKIGFGLRDYRKL